MQWFLLVATILVGSLSSYTTTITSRGPEGAEAVLGQGPIRSILGGTALLALIAAVIWGLIYLQWYWVLLALVGILLVTGMIYGGRGAFPFWYTIQPLLDLLCIAGSGYLWIFGKSL